MDWLLGLRRFSLSDGDTRLGWVHPLPAWAWVALVLAAAALAGWSYSHLHGPRAGRITLAGLRVGLLMLLMALLAGPQLVLDEDDTQQDWLLVLVDRSASMGIRDAQLDPDPASPVMSRDEALRAAIARHAGVFGPERLGKDRRIEWLGFDAGTYRIDPLSDAGATLGPAQGRETRLRTAIEQALQRAAGRPVAGIVLMTDGRSPQASGAELTRLLLKDVVKVFPVPLGASRSPLDLSIARVDHPERAFVNDIVPVEVTVERRGGEGGQDAGILVRLVDAATDRVLDEQAPDAQAGLTRPVRLVARSAAAGTSTWRVEVRREGPGEPERNTQNNAQAFAVELIDRPIRVLYVEGYPRWEYRYLSTLLTREKGVRSSLMLLSADRSFAQEGNDPITRLPNTAKELEPYDVVLIGDVSPDDLGTELMGLLRDHVAAQGAAVMWIGGEGDTPRGYGGTPLTDLLPMRQPASVRRWEVGGLPFTLRPTAAAEALHIMRLRSDSDDPSARGAAWPAELPALHWGQDLGPLKPGAEELAVFRLDDRTIAPAIARVRYGAGQSLYVATDETWRWRYGRGELYFEQFWTQLIQMLGRGRLRSDRGHLALSLSHRQVETEQTVVVQLRITDSLLLDRELPRVRLSVLRAQDAARPGAGPVDRLDLVEVRPLAEEAGAPRRLGKEYEARWTPSLPGDFVLRLDDPVLADADLAESLRVVRPDDEMRETAADPSRLQALAADTGGQVVLPHELDRLTQLVPSRRRTTTRSITQTLWDSPLALLSVLTLLTAEWLGRKLLRLV